MRFDRANSALETYLNQEAYLNNLKRISINSGTEYALGVSIVDASGNQVIPIGQPTTIVTIRKAVALAGTREQITAVATPCKKVVLCASLGNTNPVVVGDNAVVAANATQRGIVLVPGNDPITIEIDDVSDLWVDSITNGDVVCATYFN